MKCMLLLVFVQIFLAQAQIHLVERNDHFILHTTSSVKVFSCILFADCNVITSENENNINIVEKCTRDNKSKLFIHNRIPFIPYKKIFKNPFELVTSCGGECYVTNNTYSLYENVQCQLRTKDYGSYTPLESSCEYKINESDDNCVSYDCVYPPQGLS